jgi:hypothetical protein
VFGNADAQQGHEDDPERMKAGERRHHPREEGRDGGARELALHLDRLLGPRIDLGERHRRDDGGNHPDDEQQEQEQQRGIGQLVPDAFHPVQHAGQGSAGRHRARSR